MLYSLVFSAYIPKIKAVFLKETALPTYFALWRNCEKT
jgi:hypothetical protein